MHVSKGAKDLEIEILKNKNKDPKKSIEEGKENKNPRVHTGVFGEYKE